MLQYKVGEDAEQVKTHILLVGMQNNTAYLKTAWRFLIKKKNIHSPYDPASLLGICPGEMKNYVHTMNDSYCCGLVAKSSPTLLQPHGL